MNGLPPEFTQFVRQLCAQSTSDGRGLRELRVIWRRHHDSKYKPYEQIPGYAEWPKANPATGLPHGWSETNLRRRALPEPPEQSATNQPTQ